MSEPVAFEYQHEETGVIGYVDQWQIDNGFFDNNPRLQLIGPLYRHPSNTDLEQELESVKDLVKRQNAGWGEDKAELHYLREALDLIINMDNQMFTLGDACSVAIDAVFKAGQEQDNG